MKRYFWILMLVLGLMWPKEVWAVDTGFKTTTSTAAVASSAGDNNGFETTYGTNTPKDTTTDNAAGLRSANTSSGAATDGCGTFPQAEDDQHDFYNFGFSVPVGSTIDGVEVGTQLMVSSNSGTNLFCFALSYDAGAHWTTAYSSGDIGTTETAKTLGGAADTWGRSWSPADFSDANFRMRVMLDPSATLTYSFSMDLLQVKVYYTTEANPPTPNPMTFATVPGNDSTSQISMAASTATDDYSPPVNYLFTNDNSSCGSNAGTGGTSSSWQASTTYLDTGLQPNQCYGYTVQARDAVLNTGTVSSLLSVYTSVNTPGTPTLTGATVTTLNLTNDANGNPASNPTTNFAVQVSSASNSDATWLNKWVNASGDPSDTAVWMTDAALDALVIRGLDPGVTYGVKVKAKNQDGDETGLSVEGQGITAAAIISVSVADGVVSYGVMSFNASKTTIDLTDTQVLTNDGNITETFNIKGQNTSCPWTLAATSASEQYVHQFCKGTDISCSSPPTNFTALTTNYQTLYTGVGVSGTKQLDLRLLTPTSTVCGNQQSVDVTIQAIQ